MPAVVESLVMGTLSVVEHVIREDGTVWVPHLDAGSHHELPLGKMLWLTGGMTAEELAKLLPRMPWPKATFRTIGGAR